jgi:hypothetical protein
VLLASARLGKTAAPCIYMQLVYIPGGFRGFVGLFTSLSSVRLGVYLVL